MRRAPAEALWVAIAVFVLALEPSKVGLSSGETAEVDVRRWLVLAPLFGSMLVWSLLQPSVRRVGSTPVRYLLAAAAWAIIVAPFGASPPGDVLLGLGEFAVVLTAVAMVGRLGWDRWMQIVVLTVAGLCLAAVVFDPPVGHRTEGLFSAANTLGSHGAIVAVEGVRRWLVGRRAAWLGVAFVGWLAMVAADSRTAILATVIGTVLLCRQALPREVRWPLASMALASLALLATSDVGQDLGASLSRSGELTEITTATGRTEIWGLDLELVGDRPLTGWGHSGSKTPFREAFETEVIFWDPQEAHNAVLQAAVQSGLPAAALLLAAGLALVRRMLREPWAGRDAVVAVVLINGLTESLYREPRSIWFILAGAAYAAAGGPGGLGPAHGWRSVDRDSARATAVPVR